MCTVIVINRGEKEIGNPREFKEHFGFMPILELGYSDIDENCCLCQIDVDASLSINDIPFVEDPADNVYYVGQLDKLVFED